jgi:hypothetical protein
MRTYGSIWFQLGAIAKVDQVRLGLAYESSTWYSLKMMNFPQNQLP